MILYYDCERRHICQIVCQNKFLLLETNNYNYSWTSLRSWYQPLTSTCTSIWLHIKENNSNNWINSGILFLSFLTKWAWIYRQHTVWSCGVVDTMYSYDVSSKNESIWVYIPTDTQFRHPTILAISIFLYIFQCPSQKIKLYRYP